MVGYWLLLNSLRFAVLIGLFCLMCLFGIDLALIVFVFNFVLCCY